MKKKTVVLIGAAVVVSALVGLSVINGMKPPVLPCEKAKAGDVESVISFTGRVKPEKTKAYFGPNEVEIKKINFEVGDHVKAGDVIIEFDQQDLADQTTQSYLQFRNTEIALEELKYNDEVTQEDYDEALSDIRYYKNKLDDAEDIDPAKPDPAVVAQMQVWEQRLAAARTTRDMYEDKFMTDYQFEKARNAVTAAEIQYKQVKEITDKGKKGLVAEADGIISQLNAMEGGFSTAAQPLVVINHTGIVKASFSMGKYDVEKIQIGQPVAVTFGKNKLEGKVTRIAGEAVADQSGSAMLSADVEIQDPQNLLKIGLEVDMDITAGTAKGVIAIPVESVKTDRDGDYCYVLKPDEKKKDLYKPVKTYIKIGLSSDTYTQVLEGINIDDLVVTIAPKDIDKLTLVSQIQDESSGANKPELGNEKMPPHVSDEE